MSAPTELMVQDNGYYLNPLIESSMTTIPAFRPEEPNFFWSGSGDDPDAGMTYWITTTVFRMSTTTLVRHSTTTKIVSTILVSTTTVAFTPSITWNATSPPTKVWPKSNQTNSTTWYWESIRFPFSVPLDYMAAAGRWWIGQRSRAEILDPDPNSIGNGWDVHPVPERGWGEIRSHTFQRAQ